jgi:hypothetical protein
VKVSSSGLCLSGRAQKLFSSPKRPYRRCGPCSLYSVGTVVLSGGSSGWGVKLTTTPSDAEVKNEWRCTSAPPIRLHGVNWDFFYGLCRGVLVCVESHVLCPSPL